MAGQATGHDGSGCGGSAPAETESDEALRRRPGFRRTPRRAPTRAPTTRLPSLTLGQGLDVLRLEYTRGQRAYPGLAEGAGFSIGKATGTDDVESLRLTLSSKDFITHGPDVLVVGTAPAGLWVGAQEVAQVIVDAVEPATVGAWRFTLHIPVTSLGAVSWPFELVVKVPVNTPLGSRVYSSAPVKLMRHDDLSPMLEPILNDADPLPALAAAVVSGSRLIAIGAVGIRAKEHVAPVTDGDRWHLGSDSKAMTATLLAKLIDGGALTWETTLPQAFGTFASSIDPGYAAITLEHLVTNRGGVPTDVPPAILQVLKDDASPITQTRAWFAEETLTAAPAQVGYAYSNGGFIIAAAAMEAASGKPWEALMHEHLFGPIGASTCGFGPPGTSNGIDEPRGHTRDAQGGLHASMDPGWALADNPPAFGPSGRVHCSLADWGKFLRLHLRGAQGDESYLPKWMWQRMHKRFDSTVDYAHGWGVSWPSWAGLLLAHDGTNTKWYATVNVAPNRDRALMVVTNAGPHIVGGQTDPDDSVYEAMGAGLEALRAAYVTP